MKRNKGEKHMCIASKVMPRKLTNLDLLALCALMYVQLTHQFHPTFMPFDCTNCSLQCR